MTNDLEQDLRMRKEQNAFGGGGRDEATPPALSTRVDDATHCTTMERPDGAPTPPRGPRAARSARGGTPVDRRRDDRGSCPGWRREYSAGARPARRSHDALRLSFDRAQPS